MNHQSTEFAPRLELQYPFKRGWNPKPGEPFEVADGVFWLRVPMPIALDHINLWILRDGDGWVIVDSGLDAPQCKAVWDKVFDNFMTPESVNRIIVTHFHPDHIGLAAWLAHRCECEIYITEGEFRHYHAILNRDKETHPQQAQQFINEIGFEKDFSEVYNTAFAIDDKPLESRVQQHMCRFIQHDDEIKIDNRQWRVVMGNGHSPEHACLYCPQLELMIAGDQALPRISSNVSVFILNRHQNPLGDWLDSCARISAAIPADTLILPAHQEPFIGLDHRMQQLIDEHTVQLNRLREKMQAPTTTDQARRVLFDRELGDFETLMATSETLAHINYLVHHGELQQQIADNGVVNYSLKT